MSDGTLRFNTKIDNSNAEKDLKDLERKIRKAEEDIAKNENAKLPLVKQMEKLNAELAEAKSNLAYIQSEMAAAQLAMEPGSSPEDYLRASQELPNLQQSAAAQEKALAALQKQWDSVTAKVEGYDLKIQKATADIAANREKAAELTGQTSKQGALMKAGFEKAGKAAQNFGTRLLSIAKSVFIFSVLYKMLQKVIQYMNKLLQSNKEYQDQMAKLRGALMTAFQPIYEFILPGLIKVLQVLTAIVAVVANVLSLLLGKTADQSAEAAENLNKEAEAIDKVGGAADKASKSLANFDEINTLTTEKSAGGAGGGGGGATPDFGDFDITEYKEKIAELTVYLSGALLAIGAILAFSGVNIPLGIALMAAGALGLVAVIKEDWSKVSDEVKNRITKIMSIASGALLAIGAILTFSGANIPLGIGLMIAGAAALGTVVAINWNTIETALKGPIGKVVAIVSGSLLAVGAILAFTGVALPLGISLMAAGAAGLVTVAKVNWNSIQEKINTPLGQVLTAIAEANLVIGVILAFAGFFPLGFALIKDHYSDILQYDQVNWNALPDNIKSVWGDIAIWFDNNVAHTLTLAYWKDKFSWVTSFFEWLNTTFMSPIKEGFSEIREIFLNMLSGDLNLGEVATGVASSFKDMINKIISGFNSMLVNIFGEINTIITKLKTTSIFGKYPFENMKVIFPVPQIPQLAQGAVLPPNRPFMAVVGDQKNGTNIEAPLATIQEALANVLAQQGSGDIHITFTGDLAQLGRVLKPVIDRENSRVGTSLATGG